MSRWATFARILQLWNDIYSVSCNSEHTSSTGSKFGGTKCFFKRWSQKTDQWCDRIHQYGQASASHIRPLVLDGFWSTFRRKLPQQQHKMPRWYVSHWCGISLANYNDTAFTIGRIEFTEVASSRTNFCFQHCMRALIASTVSSLGMLGWCWNDWSTHAWNSIRVDSEASVSLPQRGDVTEKLFRWWSLTGDMRPFVIAERCFETESINGDAITSVQQKPRNVEHCAKLGDVPWAWKPWQEMYVMACNFHIILESFGSLKARIICSSLESSDIHIGYCCGCISQSGAQDMA